MFVFPRSVFLAAALLSSPRPEAAPPVEILDLPIPFSDDRTRAMLEYRRTHEDPRATDLSIRPRVIVVHHTAIATLPASLHAFERPFLGKDRPHLAKQGAVNVSAHFLVARDGRIHRLMPETQMARHTIGLNHLAIGIENVGGTKETPLTPAQLEANIALIRWLSARHDITHLIGHHEYRRMESHPYWREKNATYRTAKRDPGPAFMRALRERLVDLGLSGPPSGP